MTAKLQQSDSPPVGEVFLPDEQATVRFGFALGGALGLPEADKSAADNTVVNKVGDLRSAAADTGSDEGGVWAPRQTRSALIVYLYGELGAGKTTLTRGVLRFCGYPGAVKSPTYTLVEPYDLKHCQIVHFDLYRLSQAEEVEYLGVADYFYSADACLIEWPDNGGMEIPAPDIKIQLNDQGNGRVAQWWSKSRRGADVIERLQARCRNLLSNTAISDQSRK